MPFFTIGMQLEFLFVILILILSVIIHEVSHGYAANALGDPTAKLSGRLTLNPVSHLDPVGSFLVPALTYFLGGFILGWAKPVPYNPYNLKNQRWGEAIVSIAGPASNILLAVIFGLFIRFAPDYGIINPRFFEIFGYIVIVNLVLAVFNLVPIPPLDGSKVLFSILPYRYQGIREFLERNWIIAMLVFVLFLWRFILPVVSFFFNLITATGL